MPGKCCVQGHSHRLSFQKTAKETVHKIVEKSINKTEMMHGVLDQWEEMCSVEWAISNSEDKDILKKYQIEVMERKNVQNFSNVIDGLIVDHFE